MNTRCTLRHDKYTTQAVFYHNTMVFSCCQVYKHCIHACSIHVWHTITKCGVFGSRPRGFILTRELGILYHKVLSGTLGRVSQPLSTTCTTLQDEAQRCVVCGKRCMSYLVSISTRLCRNLQNFPQDQRIS